MGPAYRHSALLYAGQHGFLEGTVPFIRAGIAAEEPTLVVLPKGKIELLRAEIGSDGPHVQFADMQHVGSNPARIIPAWRRFVEAHPGRSLRGIGEPIFPARGPAELRECQHHERLLNPALAGSGLYLLCPYDTEAMGPDVIEEAQRSHPLVHDAGIERDSDQFLGRAGDTGLLHEPLPPPAAEFTSLPVPGVEHLAAARAFIREQLESAGLSLAHQADLVLALNEIATNSILHGKRATEVRIWREPGTLVTEVRGGGRIDDPLLDRTPVPSSSTRGRGLWLANQLCDLVQLRSLGDGVVARMHVRVPS